MPVLRRKRQIRPDGERRDIMRIKIEDFLLSVCPDQTNCKTTLQGERDTDSIILFSFKGLIDLSAVGCRSGFRAGTKGIKLENVSKV